MTAVAPLAIPTSVVIAAKPNPATLLFVRVHDRGIEPLFFEDEWIVIDIADNVVRNGDVFTVSWSGEACVYQLMSRGR